MNELATRQNKDFVQQQAITPAIWQMLSEIAQSSTVSQVERTKIIKKMLFCFENQLPLSVAVNGGLYVVGDRLEAEGTVIRAQIRKHPHYDYRIDRLDDKGCTMTALCDGEEIGSVTFDESDAKKADLLGKDGYKKYPTDLYLGRATSRLFKRLLPDIFFHSVYVRGEVSNDEPMIINQTTVQSLTDTYGHEKVLEAASACGGDIDAMVEYLQGDNNES